MATTDDPSLYWLYDSLKHTIGEREAGALMQLVPTVPWDDLVTKEDLHHALRTEITGVRTDLETQITGVRADMASLRTDLETQITGIRTDMASLRADLETQISGVRTDLGAEIGGLRGDMLVRFAEQDARFERALRFQLIWIVATMITMTGALAGLITTIG